MPRRFIRLTALALYGLLQSGCVSSPSCVQPSASGTLVEIGGVRSSFAGDWSTWTPHEGGEVEVMLFMSTVAPPEFPLLEFNFSGTVPSISGTTLPIPGTYPVGVPGGFSAQFASDYPQTAVADSGSVTILSSGGALQGRFDFWLHGISQLAGRSFHAYGDFQATAGVSTGVCLSGTAVGTSEVRGDEGRTELVLG